MSVREVYYFQFDYDDYYCNNNNYYYYYCYYCYSIVVYDSDYCVTFRPLSRSRMHLNLVSFTCLGDPIFLRF